MNANGLQDIELVNHLLGYGRETEWIEFKLNQNNPEMIGKLCSALSNGARLNEREKGYCIWGIEDRTIRLKGTTFDPLSERVGGENLEFWLAKQLKPGIHIDFRSIDHPDGRIVLMEIPPATGTFTYFSNVPYIRVGDATPRLTDYPDKQQRLMRLLGSTEWERDIALQHHPEDRVLELLNHEKYFELVGKPLPGDHTEVLRVLSTEGLALPDDSGNWNITNLGAILLARDLGDFGTSIRRKGTRFRVYKGGNRSNEVIQSIDGSQGYALELEELVGNVMRFVPVGEQINGVLREDVPQFPEGAVRELIVNSLIHQDFTITGAGPRIEMFSDRLEVTNPGKPLIEVDRMIDLPPRSRNESLADLMRRMGFCEEMGTGLDKVILLVEEFRAPPPSFVPSEDALQVTLLGPKTFVQMTEEERLRACYFHSVMKYLGNSKMTNGSFRERLRFEGGNPKADTVKVSAIIAAALENELIAVADPAHPRSGYVPFWAK